MLQAENKKGQTDLTFSKFMSGIIPFRIPFV